MSDSFVADSNGPLNDDWFGLTVGIGGLKDNSLELGHDDLRQPTPTVFRLEAITDFSVTLTLKTGLTNLSE